MTRLTLAIIILALVTLACGSQIPISSVKEVRAYKHAPQIDTIALKVPSVDMSFHVIGVAYLFERRMEAETK